jgi:hypothetical protein
MGHLWLDVAVKGGFDVMLVLLQDPCQVPSTLTNVPSQPSAESRVSIRVNKYFDVQELLKII